MTTSYLTRLVDRAFERAPVLQRRRPSLFESEPRTDAHLDAWDDTRDQETLVAREPRVSRHRPHDRSDNSLAPVTPLHDSARAPMPPQEPHDEGVVQQSVPTPIAVDRDDVARGRKGPEASASEHPDRQRSIERVVVTREVERTRLAIADAEGSEAGHDPAALVRVETHGTPEPARRVEREPIRAETSRRQAKPDDDARDVPRPRRMLRTAEHSPATRSAMPTPADRSRRDGGAAPIAPPTVHVTIGRIEVHAARSSETPRAPRRSEPMLSLDQYLQGRSGGRT